MVAKIVVIAEDAFDAFESVKINMVVFAHPNFGESAQ